MLTGVNKSKINLHSFWLYYLKGKTSNKNCTWGLWHSFQSSSKILCVRNTIRKPVLYSSLYNVEGNKSSLVPDKDMSYSCFATTKYSWIKCGHSVCNHCLVFKDDEETPGWVAGKSMGYCIACEKEGASTNNGHKKKANSGQGMETKSRLGETTRSRLGETTSSRRGETTSSGQGEKIDNNEKDKREAMGWWVVFLTVYAALLNWFVSIDVCTMQVNLLLWKSEGLNWKAKWRIFEAIVSARVQRWKRGG